MAILIDKNKKVIVQGITGREGIARAKLMKGYGSNIVAGTSPGKGGCEVEGIPVFDTVQQIVDKMGQIDVSVLFIPAPLVKHAALEAFAAGVKLVVIVPDRVPVYDVMEIAAYAKKYNANFLGPNTLGTLSVDIGILGMIGGKAESAKKWFKKGSVGIVSRSGGITSSLAYYLNKQGIGQTSIVHVGGDPILGMPIQDIALLFENDPETKAIVIFGEIGTSQEETVAEYIMQGKIKKPVIAYIGGKGAKEGTRFSHAGAIVEGNKGSFAGKVEILKKAAVTVVDDYDEVATVTLKILKEKNIPLTV